MAASGGPGGPPDAVAAVWTVVIVRVLRIAAVTGVLLGAFRLSEWAGRIRGNEPVEGLTAAVGALALLFLVRAVATEWARGPEMNLQKDFLWGLSLGCATTAVLRVLG